MKISIFLLIYAKEKERENDMKKMHNRWIAALLTLILVLPLAGCGEKVQDPKTLLEGKKISVIGDSISTYDGVCNDPVVNPTLRNNTFYYRKGYFGMEIKDTWWQQTADALGAEILVNNSWSGSCTLLPKKGIGSEAYGDRSVNLHNRDGVEPDIIAVYMGTNDFNSASTMYGNPNQIDYDNLVAADGSFQKPETFCEAYALMLARMKHRYPNAEIYCMTVLERNDNKDASRMDFFNGFIKAIAEKSGAYVVNLYEDSGIDATKLSTSVHIADATLHPSNYGMDAITGCLVSAILENSAYIPDDFETCDVDYKLNNVIVTEGTTQVVPKGQPFTCSLFAGRNVQMVIEVSMDGKDITDKCLKDGIITIEKVTGDIKIKAEA